MALLDAKRMLQAAVDWQACSDDFPTLQEAKRRHRRSRPRGLTLPQALEELRPLQQRLLGVALELPDQEQMSGWCAFVLQCLQPALLAAGGPVEQPVALRGLGLGAERLRALVAVLEAAHRLRCEGRRRVPWAAHLSPGERLQCILRFVNEETPGSQQQDMAAALDLGSTTASYAPWLAPEARARVLALRKTEELLCARPVQLLAHSRDCVMVQLYWYPAALGHAAHRFFCKEIARGALQNEGERHERRVLECIVIAVFSTHAPELQLDFARSLEGQLLRTGPCRPRFGWLLLAHMARGGCPRALRCLATRLCDLHALEELLRDQEGLGVDLLSSVLQLQPWAEPESWRLQERVLCFCASLRGSAGALLGVAPQPACPLPPPARKRAALGAALKQLGATLQFAGPARDAAAPLTAGRCPALPGAARPQQAHENLAMLTAAQWAVDAVLQAEVAADQLTWLEQDEHGELWALGPEVPGLAELLQDALEAAAEHTTAPNQAWAHSAPAWAHSAPAHPPAEPDAPYETRPRAWTPSAPAFTPGLASHPEAADDFIAPLSAFAEPCFAAIPFVAFAVLPLPVQLLTELTLHECLVDTSADQWERWRCRCATDDCELG